MKDRRRVRPCGDWLERKELLSALGAIFHGPALFGPFATTGGQTIALGGRVTGHFHAKEIPHAGKFYEFSGSGAIAVLGHVTVTATIDLPGLLISPVTGTTPNVNATGKVTYADSRGSVTLSVTGPSQDNAETLPATFLFTVTGATGRFRGDTRSGVLNLGVTPTTSASTRPLPGFAEHGTFSMVLRPSGTP
jgi:hypothetical protein